jgi:hypothetical protein
MLFMIFVVVPLLGVLWFVNLITFMENLHKGKSTHNKSIGDFLDFRLYHYINLLLHGTSLMLSQAIKKRLGSKQKNLAYFFTTSTFSTVYSNPEKLHPDPRTSYPPASTN